MAQRLLRFALFQLSDPSQLRTVGRCLSLMPWSFGIDITSCGQIRVDHTEGQSCLDACRGMTRHQKEPLGVGGGGGGGAGAAHVNDMLQMTEEEEREQLLSDKDNTSCSTADWRSARVSLHGAGPSTHVRTTIEERAF